MVRLNLFKELEIGMETSGKAMEVENVATDSARSVSAVLMQVSWITMNFSFLSSPAKEKISIPLGLHFGSKKTDKISIVFEDLSRNSVFF